MTAPAIDATPHAIVRMDARRGPRGERFRGLAFPSAEAAHRWLDAQSSAIRRALVDGGFRVQPVPERIG